MLRMLLLLILSTLLWGCQRGGPNEAEAPLPLRLAYTTQHDCSLVHVAQAKGFFRDEGVVVIPRIVSFGKQALEQVLQGRADLATVAETPFVFAVHGGEKITLLASIFSSGKNHAIVAKGVTSLVGLKGKRIGVTPGTTSEIYLDAFLVGNRLSPRDVVQVPLKPDQMLDALMTGEVTAVSAWNPTLKMVSRALGKEGTVFSDPHIYTEHFVLAGKPAFVEQNRRLVERVLRALVRAEQYARSHPEQARQLASGSLQIAPELLAELWSESRLEVQLTHSLISSLEEESRWAMKYRHTDGMKMPNYLDFIDHRPLRSVAPEAVSFNR